MIRFAGVGTFAASALPKCCFETRRLDSISSITWRGVIARNSPRTRLRSELTIPRLRSFGSSWLSNESPCGSNSSQKYCNAAHVTAISLDTTLGGVDTSTCCPLSQTFNRLGRRCSDRNDIVGRGLNGRIQQCSQSACSFNFGTGP